MRSYSDIVRAWAADQPLDELTQEQRRLIALIASGTATEEQLASAGAEFVVGIKSHLPHEVRETGAFVAKAAQENVLTWKYSDDKPDRMGDIIRQDGWELANYKRNPVILWGHAHGFDSVADEPIGRSLELRVDKGALYGDILFDVEDERAARIFRKARAGFVQAGSVGFRPLKTSHVSDDAERTKLGLGRFGVIFDKAELLEFSLCAIPANPNALQQAVKSGAITEADADEAYALRTEKDWERYEKRRARSTVTVAGDPLATALTSLASSIDADARARAIEHKETMVELAAQRLALTELGGHLSTLRSKPTAPQGSSVTAPRVADSATINAINSKLDKILGNK